MADLSKDPMLFEKEHKRMCKAFYDTNCFGCELEEFPYCEIDGVSNTEEDNERIFEAVQIWSDEHPMDSAEEYIQNEIASNKKDLSPLKKQIPDAEILESIKKLRLYAAYYSRPPFGREVDGTARLLRKAAEELEYTYKLVKNLEEERANSSTDSMQRGMHG